MIKLILSVNLLLITTHLKAQTITTERAVYLALNRDSMITLYSRLIFTVKNGKGETLESFGKKTMGKNYDKLLVPMFDTARQKDLSLLKAFAFSMRFKKLKNQVQKEFADDMQYKKQLNKTWFNARSVLNELICTKKEYEKCLYDVLERDKLYFTFLMLPLVVDMNVLFDK
jgi:hypothetical protein